MYLTETSPLPVVATVAGLTDLLAERSMTVFATIDQRAAAQAVGLELRETVLLVFGSPVAGTPVMQAVPLAALDLPLKLLVWDDAGRTRISYLDPDVLAERNGLPGALAAPLRGIGKIVAGYLTNLDEGADRDHDR